MYTARYLSPMVPSYNIPGTVAFFTSLLDFKIVRDDKTYVILMKDQVTVHILRAGMDIGQMEFYLEVDDVEKVWQQMQPGLSGLKVRAPFDRDYGMREIHVQIPETNTLMFIGQMIR
ncbi:MAG: hypothetical protein JST46_04800 [Bacteroidetes bacterium]|nr:hypothetical protein [Bacteroidota bacterium]